MRYSLRRLRDGAGDEGGMSLALWKEDDVLRFEHDSRPRVGVQLRVGSTYARTFATQDWWQTTPITEILEERDDYVRFRTGNSTYEWRVL